MTCSGSPQYTTLNKLYTVLSWISAHGCLQLKCQNLRVGSYTEDLLKWLNYPHARAHPGCKVSCHGTKWTCIVGSSVIRGQPNSGESGIVLQSRPTRSLVVKFLQHSVIACSTWISCCRARTMWMRPWTGMCEPVMPDVVSPEVHQNNWSYVTPVDLPSDSLCENLAWWPVTRRALKTTKLSKLGVGAGIGMDTCTGQYCTDWALGFPTLTLT